MEKAITPTIFWRFFMAKPGFISQFITFFKANKWWFLVPMFMVFLLILLLIFLGGENTVPFIYQL